MDTLPDLPLFEVLIKLSTSDLRSLCHTGKRFYRFLIGNEYFWQTKIDFERFIKYKYFDSWYQTYKHIKTIPIFINIDNSEIYGGPDFLNGTYATGNYQHLQCNYNPLPQMYINHYPGEKFESIINKVHDYCKKLVSTFVVMYFKDDLVLGVSSCPTNIKSTFLAGIIPNKILIFNDPFLVNNFHSHCIYGNPFRNQSVEHAREIFRMVCKQMILQYPEVNIYKLIYAREQSELDGFELELELSQC